MEKILITGSSGFLGSRLAYLLKDKYDLLLPAHDELNVRDVARNIEKAISLPGGVYNFGSGNTLNSYDLHLHAAERMGLQEPCRWILPDEERFADTARNLTMDCSLIENHGIRFRNSIDGIAEAINHPFRY